MVVPSSIGVITACMQTCVCRWPGPRGAGGKRSLKFEGEVGRYNCIFDVILHVTCYFFLLCCVGGGDGGGDDEEG